MTSERQKKDSYSGVEDIRMRKGSQDVGEGMNSLLEAGYSIRKVSEVIPEDKEVRRDSDDVTPLAPKPRTSKSVEKSPGLPSMTEPLSDQEDISASIRRMDPVLRPREVGEPLPPPAQTVSPQIEASLPKYRQRAKSMICIRPKPVIHTSPASHPAKTDDDFQLQEPRKTSLDLQVGAKIPRPKPSHTRSRSLPNHVLELLKDARPASRPLFRPGGQPPVDATEERLFSVSTGAIIRGRCITNTDGAFRVVTKPPAPGEDSAISSAISTPTKPGAFHMMTGAVAVTGRPRIQSAPKTFEISTIHGIDAYSPSINERKLSSVNSEDRASVASAMTERKAERKDSGANGAKDPGSPNFLPSQTKTTLKPAPDFSHITFSRPTVIKVPTAGSIQVQSAVQTMGSPVEVDPSAVTKPIKIIIPTKGSQKSLASPGKSLQLTAVGPDESDGDEDKEKVSSPGVYPGLATREAMV